MKPLRYIFNIVCIYDNVGHSHPTGKNLTIMGKTHLFHLSYTVNRNGLQVESLERERKGWLLYAGIARQEKGWERISSTSRDHVRVDGQDPACLGCRSI